MGLRQPSIQEQLDAMKMRSEQLRAEGNTAAADALDQQIQAKTAELAFGGRQQPLTAVPANQDISGMDNQPFEEPAMPEPVMPESAMPETEMPEPVEESTPALQTTLPEPGKTAAIDEETDQQPEETPDEFEQMYKDYDTARKQYGEDIEALGKESDEASSKQTMMTGIAGALQSFGEGLAAITGGSAKPLQTASETIRRVGEQGAAAREGRAKTLKERLMMARQPLEAKIEETKFRDVFEQRQKSKRLEDPASPESAQARELANNFLDAYAASLSNRVDDTQLTKIESIRPKLEKLNANQIKDFMDNLNKLKFTESRVDIEEAKGERAAKQQEAKTVASQEFAIQKQAQKDINKVDSELEQDQKFYNQYNTFKSNLQKAIAGDLEAQKYIKNNMGAFSYLKARTLESKGVFTDQDAERLTTLLKDQTWAEQFSAWLESGMQGTIPVQTLKKLSDALKDDPKNPNAVRNEKLQRFANTAKKSSNPAIKNSASYYESLLSESEPSAEPSMPVQKPQGGQPNYEFKDSTEFQKAIPSIKFKIGDIIKIGNEYRKVQPNGKAVRIEGP